MKYSIYVKKRIERYLLKKNKKMDRAKLENEVNKLFHELLFNASYESVLIKLDDNDPLKKLELEPSVRFLDLHPGADRVISERNIYGNLYHGIRFDDNHELLASILDDEAIKCGNLTNNYYRSGGDNCNEGEYISLINYTGDYYDLEFKTFIEENVSLIISPKLNPIKCKYLPYEEWEERKKKLPISKSRYSYAKNEFQYPKEIPFNYVIGILYPFHYYVSIKGYSKTKEDFKRLQELLREKSYSYLPILDPTDGFTDISNLFDERNHFVITRENVYNF